METDRSRASTARSFSSYDDTPRLDTPRVAQCAKQVQARLRQVPVKRLLKRCAVGTGRALWWCLRATTRWVLRIVLPSSDPTAAPEGWPTLPAVDGRGRRRRCLHPDSWQRQLWNCLAFLALAWPALAVPFLAGFVRDLPAPVELVGLAADGLGALDLVLLLVTATFSEGTVQWTTSALALARAYLRRPLAVGLDLLALVPLDALAPPLVGTGGRDRWATWEFIGAVRGLRVLKMLRLRHTGRLWRLVRWRGAGGAASSRSPHDPQNSVRDQLRQEGTAGWKCAAAALPVVTFWASCFVRGTAELDEAYCLSNCPGTNATTLAWCENDCGEYGWIGTFGVGNPSQLAGALHWTAGAMRGPLTTPLERARVQLVAAVLVMVVGSLVFAALLGELLLNALKPVDQGNVEHDARSEGVRLHHQLRQDAEGPYSRRDRKNWLTLGRFLNHSQTLVEEPALFQRTQDLFGKQMLRVFEQADSKEWMTQTAIFRGCPESELPTLRHHLAQCMVLATYRPHDVLVEPGALNTRLIVLKQGFCRQRGPSWEMGAAPSPRPGAEKAPFVGAGTVDRALPKTRSRGSVFGEEVMLRLVTSKPKMCGYTVEAVTHANTHEVDHRALLRVFKLPGVVSTTRALKRRALRVLVRKELASVMRTWSDEPDVEDFHGVMLAATGQLEGVRAERRQREQLERAAAAAELAAQKGISARQMASLNFRFEQLEEFHAEVEKRVNEAARTARLMRRQLSEAHRKLKPTAQRRPGTGGGSRPSSRASVDGTSLGGEFDEESDTEDKPVIPPAQHIALVHPDLWKKYWKLWIAKYAHRSELDDLQARLERLINQVESLSNVIAICNRHPHLDEEVIDLEQTLKKQQRIHQKLMLNVHEQLREFSSFRDDFKRERKIMRSRGHRTAWDVTL